MYSAGAEPGIRDVCRVVLKRVIDGRLAAATSSEVVQEILYVFDRRDRKAAGIELARSTLEMFPELLPVTRADFLLACDLFERLPGLRPRDAVHAATMRNNGLGIVISADAHFDKIPGLRRIAPREAAG